MTTQYKWLPEQPTEEMMIAETEQSYSRWSKYEIYRSMWKSAPEVKQEPVGYVQTRRIEEMDDVDINCVCMKNKPKSAVVTALYAHPQPKREPLNAHEIKQLLKRDDGLNVTDLVRAVEKAHGIGGE